MVKKIVVGFTMVLGAILLSACGGKAVDMTDFVEVEFNGMDTQGYVDYYVDFNELYKEVLDYDETEDVPDDETEEAMSEISEMYKISADNEEELSNGDTVTVKVSVKEDNDYKISGGEKEFTVEDLEEPEQLTSKEVEDKLVINFSGSNGAGKASIESTFNGDLSNLDFEVENDGKLENGKEANIVLEDGGDSYLSDIGYVTEDDFSPSFEVEGLEEIPETAQDIKNYEDVERMIEEEANRRNDKGLFKFKVKLEKMMYRQFNENDGNGDGMYSSDNYDGNMIGIYTVKKYEDDEKGKLRSEFTDIIGYSNLVLDENDEVNVAEMKEISDRKDDSYSLESVLKLYEGYGYDYVDGDKKDKDEEKDDKDD